MRPLFSGPRPNYDIKKENHLCRWFIFFRAGKGTRTLDPDLGKVVLYQLSYSREGDPIIKIKIPIVKGVGRKKLYFCGKISFIVVLCSVFIFTFRFARRFAIIATSA